MVWAKVTGYPWWPAQVAERSLSELQKYHNKIKVFFFGDNSHAYLSAQKLLKYQPHYDLLGSKAATNRRLRDAIELADLCADLHR